MRPRTVGAGPGTLGPAGSETRAPMFYFYGHEASRGAGSDLGPAGGGGEGRGRLHENGRTRNAAV